MLEKESKHISSNTSKTTKQNTTSNRVSFLPCLIKQNTYINNSIQLNDSDNEKEKHVRRVWNKCCLVSVKYSETSVYKKKKIQTIFKK